MNRELPDTPLHELATMTGARLILHSLSSEGLGTIEELADRLWASEMTEYRAAAMVRKAANDIAEAHRKMKQERKGHKGRR